MSELTKQNDPSGTGRALALAPEVVQQARENFRAAKADATWRAYKTDWDDWEGWAKARDISSLPASPQDVCLFLADRARRLKIATLEGRLAGISQAHKLAGVPSPTQDALVRAQMAGLRRRLGVQQVQKSAADLPTLRAMLKTLDSSGSLSALRDKTILLLGFAGAFRRSELTSLDIADLDFRPEGVLVRLRRSKTDQEGRGRIVPISKAPEEEICPVEALRAWIAAAKLTDGPVFRSLTKWGTVRKGKMQDAVVALIVQGAAEKAGFDPKRFGGHSLRAGHVTQALAGGATDREVQEVTGHAKVEMLNRYKRDVNPFDRGTGAKLYTEKKNG